jgi:hypothetical protein
MCNLCSSAWSFVPLTDCRWGPILGRNSLPAAADPLVPAVVDAALLPLYWLYRVIGPAAAWRLNNLPLFLDGPKACFVVGNLMVWGQAAALIALAAAVVRAAGRRRSIHNIHKHMARGARGKRKEE